MPDTIPEAAMLRCTLVPLAALALLLPAAAPTGADDRGIEWRADLTAALAEAGERKLLVYFFEAG